MSEQQQEIKKESILQKALETRKNIINSVDEHNLEFVNEVNGVGYVNDSMSFSVSTTLRSMESFEVPVILIIGGFDINNDYSILSGVIREKVRGVIYLGKDNEKIITHCKAKNSMLFSSASSLEEAVNIAFYYATPGNVVLFSPACASGKEFADYKVRGNEFKKAVNALIPKQD